MLEKEDVPIKVNSDIPSCELCGSILITSQERVIRRCSRCALQQT